MTAERDGKASGRGPSSSPNGHDAKRALGASMLTQRIYRAVVDAGEPITTLEIYDAIKHDLNYTDTSLWWQRRSRRKGSTGNFNIDEAGPERVAQRVRNLAMTKTGILKSDGAKGRGHRARYSPGRPPKGFAYRPSGPFGWREIDLSTQDAKRDHHMAKLRFLDEARAELAKPRLATKARELLTEAVRLIQGESDNG